MKPSLKSSASLLGVACAIAAVAHTASEANADPRDKRKAVEIERAAFAKVPEIKARATTAAVSELLGGGRYLAGDKHNHTTCSDGSTSPKVLADQSLVAFGLDWFGMVGHGGGGTRDCRFTDADYSSLLGGPVKNRVAGGDEGALWSDTVGDNAIQGDVVTSTSSVADDPATPQRERAKVRWRWQSLRDFQYQEVAAAGIQANKPAFTGLEWNVPGHEHSSAAILDGQFPGGRIGAVGNADAMAQFEYLWDRNSGDFSGGKAAGFENPANRGVPKQPNVAGDHDKSVAAVKWMRQHFPLTAFAIAAHTERQGSFVPGQNRGYNVEHLRDYHNAGKLVNSPKSYSISFGMEGQAGHQAGADRGTYSPGRPSAGFGTYGGAGAYAAAEISFPGRNFAGNPLSAADLEGTGINPAILNSTPERVTLGRPGVRTMWDAMLGEGRRFFVVGSSDWHNRGVYGPFEPGTTLDFWPGEYQKMYSFVSTGDMKIGQAEAVVKGLRSGNTYTVMGDLIGPDFAFVACYSVTGQCVTMGQELTVFAGRGTVNYEIQLTDPQGENFSPYYFDNPSLLQVGIKQPMNKPVLNRVEIITGNITGEIAPTDPRYKTNIANPSTKNFFTFDKSNWIEGPNGKRIMRWSVPVADMAGDNYVRVVGTNMPAGVPYETDANGNPLFDGLASNIVCPFDGAGDAFNPMVCPAHLPTNSAGQKVLSFDVEAWADLWFHANPIFIDVQGSTQTASR